MVKLPLFELRLKANHKNLILVKGNENEVENVPFQGSVKFLIPNDMHVKRVKLKLVGDYNVDYMQKVPGEIVPDAIIDHLCVLKAKWANLLTDSAGVMEYGDYGDRFIRMLKLEKKGKTSTPDGSRPAVLKSKSQSSVVRNQVSSLVKLPKSGVDGTPFAGQKTSFHHLFLLPKGNYNLPFSIILPANVAETVEGLRIGRIRYRLECTIERGIFDKPITLAKHVRIVRTLHPQSLNLTDLVDINNSWPGKVEYRVEMPRRGLAVGSSVPIRLVILPLAKGLKLKSLNGCIVQQSHVEHLWGRSPEYEEIIGKQDLKINPGHAEEDYWDIRTQFHLPESLSKLTQSCEPKSGAILVKHRVRISIQLLNPGGHVSELRANLPVYIYISPNSGTVTGTHLNVEPVHSNFVEDGEDTLFKHNTREQEDNNDMDREDSAPPLYQSHVFDRVYSTTTSPVGLAPTSPMPIIQLSPSQEPDSYFSITTSGSPQLVRSPSAGTPLPDVPPIYEDACDEDDGEGIELAPTYSDGLGTRSMIMRAYLAEAEGKRFKLKLGKNKHELKKEKKDDKKIKTKGN